MQIWHLLKYQDVPPALKGFQDFVFTPMSVSDAVETSIYLSCTLLAMDPGSVPPVLNYKLSSLLLY